MNLRLLNIQNKKVQKNNLTHQNEWDNFFQEVQK